MDNEIRSLNVEKVEKLNCSFSLQLLKASPISF